MAWALNNMKLSGYYKIVKDPKSTEPATAVHATTPPVMLYAILLRGVDVVPLPAVPVALLVSEGEAIG